MNDFLSQYTAYLYVGMYVLLACFCIVGLRRTRSAGFFVLLLWSLLGMFAGVTQQFGSDWVFNALTKVVSTETASRMMTGSFSVIIVSLMALLTLGVGLLAFRSPHKSSK